MKHALSILTLASSLCLATASAQDSIPSPDTTTLSAPSLETLTFFPGALSSSISAAVGLPAGQRLLLTSGTPPPILDEKAPAGSKERYGDTKTQGIGALRQIDAQLKKAGLGMQDVVFLRVYVAPDKAKGGMVDYPGWFEAYGVFFNSAENSTKPARSTVGVASLVNPDWLIEIEAVAAYPSKTAAPVPK